MSRENSSDSNGDEDVPKESARSFRKKSFFNRRAKSDALFAFTPIDPSLSGSTDAEDASGEDKSEEKIFKEASRRDQRDILTRNKRLSYIIAVTHQVGFLTPIWVIFGTDHLELSLTLSLVLGSTSWVASAIFEIPMGAFADRYGRRMSVVIGLALCALGDIALVAWQNFYLLMFFQVIAGMGFAMRSGSLEGLLHDTFEAQGAKTAYAKLSSQMLFLLNASRVLTVPVGAWLYHLDTKATVSSFTYPYIASALSYCIAMSCAGFLIEKRTVQTVLDPNEKDFKHVLVRVFGHANATFKEMYANRDIVRVVSLLGLYALVGEGNWALYQHYFRDRKIELGESMWIYTGLVICMALGARFVPVIYKRINVMWAMIGIIGLVSFNVILMHLPIGFAIIAFIANAFVGPMCLYLHDNAIQNRMSGDHKSTALSIASMTYTLGAMIGVYVVGAIADRIGVLEAQWIFVGYGAIVCAIGAMWCLSDGFGIRPEDRAATFDSDDDGYGDEEVTPFDEVPLIKP